MDARLPGGLPLSAQLDRLVAESDRRHRLVFIEHLPDGAFTVWARARAIDGTGDVAYLVLAAEGRAAVTGVVMGFEVAGDALDDALATVLSGRQLVLVTGLDRARQRWDTQLYPWLEWCAAHVPLTVANVRDAAPFVARHPAGAVAIAQLLAGRLTSVAQPSDATVRTGRKQS